MNAHTMPNTYEGPALRCCAWLPYPAPGAPVRCPDCGSSFTVGPDPSGASDAARGRADEAAWRASMR